MLQVSRERQFVVLVSANYVHDTDCNFDAIAPKPVNAKKLVEMVLSR
jgi:hypothetical protein